MKKLTHTIKIGRFEVTGQYEGVPIARDGSFGMRSEELERLELQAAIAVFSQQDLVNGEECGLLARPWTNSSPLWPNFST
jgi:hypothetical protein